MSLEGSGITTIRTPHKLTYMNIDSSIKVLVWDVTRGRLGITAPTFLVQPNMESVALQSDHAVKRSESY